MNRAEFDAYLTHFNARDYEAVLGYYHDELEISFAGYAFRSQQAVRDFYAFFHQYVHEEIDITRYVSDERTIALEADVRLTGIRAMPASALKNRGLDRLVAVPPGVTVVLPQFIHYHLRDGKFARAWCAIYERPQ